MSARDGRLLPKLVLNIANTVPELPAAARREKGLSVRRVRVYSPSDGADVVGWLLDASFIEKNAAALRTSPPPSGSLLLWNPDGEPGLSKNLPDGLVFDEILSFRNPASFLRTVRNLFRRQHLERELAAKDALLQASRAENSQLLQVGIALSAERDNAKLLNYILQQVRLISGADAGTLYLLEKDKATGRQNLRIKMTQNESNPTDYRELVFPVSKKRISGYVASTGTPLNIPDAYEIPADREYGFDKDVDKSTNYRSKSMLTVPMKDHKGEILGVIQLINRKKEPLLLSLASQAAVSLENNLLYQEIETLFEGFVQASVKAIESRDPTTSGHSNRVAVYTVDLAKAVDRADFGAYRGVQFTDEQIKEIRYASLLHDFGKVGVREHVLVKAKKLYPGQLELVKLRMAYIRRSMLYGVLKERFASLSTGGPESYGRAKEEFDRREAEYLGEIDRFLKAILASNEPTVLAEDPSRILDDIRGKTFIDEDGTNIPFLGEDEYFKLKVPRGSLDENERKEIESHVTHTYRFLSTIPWTKEMKEIPVIAWGHHEKLDGTGYPENKNARQIPIQTRMMTVSDIFDALTASDRPYKPAVSAQKALDIITAEVKEEKLDQDLVKIFIESKIWQKKDALLAAPKPAAEKPAPAAGPGPAPQPTAQPAARA
jgi:HD-GYP domain-containing protein (c-di-GMP phosphodiesterase class II)